MRAAKALVSLCVSLCTDSPEPALLKLSRSLLLVHLSISAMKSSKEMCANGLKNSNLSDIVPVTSLLTLRTYINIHCLVCNEGIHDGDDAVQPWRIVLVEGLVALVDAFYENQQAVLDSLTIFTRKRNIHFVPESQIRQYLEPCQAIDVDSCNVTGLWDVHNIHITSVCESGHQLPVVETFANKNIVFKNVGCVQCNRGRDNPYTHRRCSLEEGSESLDIPRLDINHNIDNDDRLMRWLEDLAVIFNETVAVKKRCADGYYHIKVISTCILSRFIPPLPTHMGQYQLLSVLAARLSPLNIDHSSNLPVEICGINYTGKYTNF